MNKWLGAEANPVGTDVLYQGRRWMIVRKNNGWLTLRRWRWLRAVTIKLRTTEIL